jgi:hypothetical protein
MSKTKEQSAIDIIYSLLDKVDLLDKKIDMIDTNVKHLNNKVSQIRNSVNAGPSRAKPGLPSQPSAQPSAVAPNTIQKSEVAKLVLGSIKVFGYIADKNRVPITDVVINVYNQQSELVKSESSNKDGHWEVRLPSGRYGVEYSHSRFKSINRTISLEEDMSAYEVK